MDVRAQVEVVVRTIGGERGQTQGLRLNAASFGRHTYNQNRFPRNKTAGPEEISSANHSKNFLEFLVL